MSDPIRRGPLAEIRVLELAGLGPAQLGAMLLADLWADVIRLDRPSDVPDEVEGVSRELLARGRRSVALDLKSPRGLELALAGALHPIGDAASPPPVPLNLVGDFGGGGMLLAFAVAAALVERERSGRGQVVDVAMIDGVAALMTSIFQVDSMGQWDRERGSNWLQGAAPWYRSYETADGRYLTVGSLEPQFYALLLGRLGLDAAEWPQWDRERWPLLTARVAELFKTRTLAEWCGELEGTDACFAPALTMDEVTAHPHLGAREVYVEVEGVTQPAPVPRFERTPGAISSPPPWPGEHTLDVLAELGFDAGACAALVRDGAAAQLSNVQEHA